MAAALNLVNKFIAAGRPPHLSVLANTDPSNCILSQRASERAVLRNYLFTFLPRGVQTQYAARVPFLF
jgi:hypothetical protein